LVTANGPLPERAVIQDPVVEGSADRDAERPSALLPVLADREVAVTPISPCCCAADDASSTAADVPIPATWEAESSLLRHASGADQMDPPPC
jgi:hypothetical protein